MLQAAMLKLHHTKGRTKNHLDVLICVDNLRCCLLLPSDEPSGDRRHGRPADDPRVFDDCRSPSPLPHPAATTIDIRLCTCLSMVSGRWARSPIGDQLRYPSMIRRCDDPAALLMIRRSHDWAAVLIRSACVHVDATVLSPKP